MRLSDFVEETLVEIAVAVQRAKYRARNLVAIAPGTLNGQRMDGQEYVTFDVSLAVHESSEKRRSGNARIKGGIKIAVVGAEAGIDGDGKLDHSHGEKSENVHRVSFRIPIQINANFGDDPHTQDKARKLGIDAEHL